MSVFHLLSHNGLKALIDKITAYFYTKTEIDDMLSAGMKYEVVEELPATGEAGTVYLVPKQSAGTGDVYDEYIYVDGSYEHIGSTEIDLSNYYTKSQTDNLLDDKVDKESGKGLSTEDFTTAEKTKLSNIEAGAKVNVQSDWNQSDSTKDDFIKNKPTIRQPSTDGTAGQYLKSNGNGNAPSWETMDSAPTDNSTKAVTSGGVKTALDGKQASVTITTNANTPTDNDTVIMQDNGNTGTTSFLRRKLSTLWTYIKGKADGFYVPFAFVNLVGDGGSKNLWDNILDGKMWGADQRFNVTWVSYDIESGEVVETKDAKNLFNMADNYYKHPITGEKDIITISPKDGLSSSYLWTYCHGYYYLNFYSTKLPESATLRWKQRNSDTWNTATFETFGRGNQSWRALIPWGNPNVSTYVNTIEITIIGKTDSEVAWPGTSVCNLTHICTRETLGERGVVTKYAIAQNLYGNITAPKFITRGGTTSQFVLGDGTLQNAPIPVSKGGTGATTAIGAEYNILNQVADISTTLSDTRKIALCNQTKSASNGVFRWIALSNVWAWIKTHFDSSPTSGSGNGITSGGVYSALEEKVNLQPDFTVSQIDYSAGNVGKWQKVLRFPEGADLVINMKKTAMGSDATSTLWFSSSSMGDSYTSLFGNHSVRFVHDGGYVFLVLTCRKSTNEPIESYTFQIAHSSVPMSDIVAVTDASPITATPKEPSIVYRAPITTGAVSFNVTSGAGSVYMSGHNDFLGNMTSEATNGVTVTMSGATEGQIYRFVFTRNITGGVTFKQSNVAYCTIQGDVNAGDTITLTAVSNTADGWLYEQESAGIKSTDGSVNVEYNGSTADVRVNWDKLPARVVMNVAEDDYEDDKNIAIGYGASTYKLTGDENKPCAYTMKAELLPMTVDGGEEEYTHAVTAGTTYSIVRGSVTTSFTPAHSGYAVLLDLGSGYELATGNRYVSQLIAPTYASTVVLYDATESGSAPYQIVVANINSTYISRVVEGSYMLAWYVSELRRNASALGREASATGMDAVALGQRASATDLESVAVGNEAKAMGLYSTAVGRNSIASGYQSTAYGASTYARKRQSTALGTYAESDGQYASAIGSQAKANDTYATAIGQASQALSLSTTVVGYANTAYNSLSALVGISTVAGGVSGDSERPYLTAKAFSGAKFSTGGNEVYNAFVPSGGDIAITVGGTSYTLTSPSESGRMLFVVNESDAQYIYRSLINPLELDGVLVDNGGTPTNENAVIEHLSGNYYAVWIRYSSSNSVVATQTLKFYASVTRTSNDSICASVGSYNSVMNSRSVVVGTFLRTIQDGQTILGLYNKPVEGYFIVGSGTNSSNGRKNCLVIDPSERLVINASYVGGTQEINMNNQTGVMNNITKSVYRIKWNDTGTVTLTLQASGCVEGQRVTIYAETNDVHISGCTNDIPQGRFADFLFVNGAWRPMVGY